MFAVFAFIAPLSQELEPPTIPARFNTAVAASISGGPAEIRKNGSGSWGNQVLVNAGDTVNIRMSASNLLGLTMTAYVTVGTASADWKVTTVASATTLAFHAQQTSQAATITVPASVQKYDVLVLFDRTGRRSSGPTIPPPPPAVTPTGFTNVTNTTAGANNLDRQMISVKIADGTEANSTITGMGDVNPHKLLWVFRPNGVVTTLTPGSVQAQGTNLIPSNQTVTVTGRSPVLILSADSSSDPAIDVNMNPPSDGEGVTAGFGTGGMTAQYKIFNTNPTNVICSIGQDRGNASVFQSFYLEVGGPDIDVTPNAFDFADVANASLGTSYETSSVVSGFNQTLPATVFGADAQLRKNGTGTWSNSVSVVSGDTLNLRMTSSNAYATASTALVNVGNASADWRITTAERDDTPNPFDFADISDAVVSTAYEASATIGGINTTLTAAVSGGSAQIRKNGTGGWGSSVAVIAGDTLNVRMSFGDSIGVTSTTVVSVGTAVVDWRITTVAPDGTPNAFDFADVQGATPSTTYESSAVITGINVQVTAAVSGGGSQIRKNGTGAWGTSVAINRGDTLNIRMAASAGYSSATTATVTVGSIAADWRITTIPLDNMPDPFDFADVSNAAPGTLYESAAAITGINGPITASVSGAGAQIRADGAGAWATSVIIAPGHTLNVRMASSASATTVAALISVGTGAADWRITTSPVCGAGSHIYFADNDGHRIRKIDGNTGIVTTIAGTGAAGYGNGGYGGDNGPALTARFNGPYDLRSDSTGTLYVSDTLNYRVRKISPNGIVTTIAGSDIGGFGGDGGPATSASLLGPGPVVFDSSDNLYIVDSANHRVRKIDRVSGIITTVVGSGGSAWPGGFSGDGGLATNARLNYPASAVFDSTGNLYISDTDNHRIRKVDASTRVITTIVGTGVAGYGGDGGTAANARLNFPQGVSIKSGNLYVADYQNHRIRSVNLSSGIITTIAGTGSSGHTGDGGLAVNAALSWPYGIHLGSNGDLFLDSDSSRIRKVDGTTGVITTIAGNGSWDYAGDGGPATAAGFYVGGVVCMNGVH